METRKSRSYFLIPALAAAIVFLAGCGKSVSQKANEKAAEKMIEAQTGGKADVDIDDKSVKVETAQGMMESGENVKLPDDFPKDIYLIEGTVKAVISDKENQGQTISIETDKSAAEAANLYQEKLEADGWKVTGTMNYGDAASVVAEKDDKAASVIIGETDDKTTVTINVGKK